LSKGARHEIKQRAEREKASCIHAGDERPLLFHLFQDKLRNIISSNVLAMDFEVTPGVSQAIVPAEFLRQWRAWINRPQDKLRPGAIDNNWLICQHNRLVIDPSIPQDLGTSVSLVSLADWEILQDMSVISIAHSHRNLTRQS
jgi:ubiquitin carboxyl-terminal hydrolase 48